MNYTDALRRMVMMDADYVGALLRSGDTELIERADAKVLSLARVAALAGSRATAHSYSVVVADAIGAELFVSRHTVHSHATAIYRKFGVTSRSEAVERAKQFGLS